MKLKQLMVVLALAAVQAQAETVFNWTGSGGNSDWGTAANWSSSIVPGAGTNVVISGSGADVTVNYTGSTADMRLVTLENTAGFLTRLTISTPGFASFVETTGAEPVLWVGTNSEVRVSGTGTARFRSGGWGNHLIYGKVIVDDGVFEGFNSQVFYIDGSFTVNAGRVWLDSCGGNAPVSVVLRSGATMNVNGGVVTIPENLMVGGGLSYSTNSLWMTNGVLRLGVGGAGPAGRTTYSGTSGVGGGSTYGMGYFAGGIVTNLGAVLVGNDHWKAASAQWVLTGDAQWRQFGGNISVGNGRGTAYYTNAANASLVTTNNLIFGGYTSGSYDTSYGYGILAGGSVTVTNAVGTAELRIRRGSLTLCGATVTANSFVMATNSTASAFVFTGGTFTVSQVVMTNRLAFGGGTVPAVLTLLGGQSTADGGCFVSTNGVLKGSGTLTVKSGFVSLFKNATLDPDGTLELTKFSAQQSLAVPYAIGDLVRSDTLDFSGLTAGRLTVSIPLSVPPLAIRYEDRFAVFTASSGTITGFDPADWSVQVLNADYASTSAKLVNGGDGTIYLTGFGNVKGTRILLR